MSGAILAIVSAACFQLSPAAAPGFTGIGAFEAPLSTTTQPAEADATVDATTSATATPAVTLATRQAVPVRRGTIVELLPVSGRVAALDETTVTFPLLGRIDDVHVQVGDAVEQGQPLMQADATEIERELTGARSRVEVGTLRLTQAQAQARARQRQAELQIEADRVRREKAIHDAEIGLQRAQEDLARVKAGAPASERRSAEAAVVSARSAVERAEAEVTRASAGPAQTELKAADQQVWAARLALHRAQAEFARLKQGPDPTQLSAAEREVANAQSALDRARLDLDRLMKGDPAAVSAAQRDVQRAELALRTAQATRVDDRGSSSERRNARAARESAIANARLTLQDAQDRLNLARRPPPPAEVAIARRNVENAEAALQTARDRLETVKRGPDELTLAAANQAVQSAELAHREAERRYLDLEAGPPAHVVAAAQDAVRGARATLATAMERLTEINSRPTATELRDAQDRVGAAASMLEQAQVQPEVVQEEIDPASYDLMVLERNVEQDRGQLEALERALAETTLTAPVSGIVSSLLVRRGDPVDGDMPVLSIARPGDPIVIVDLTEDDAARAAPGQRATVTLEGMPDQQFEATVLDLAAGPGGFGHVARLTIDWAGSPPAFGGVAEAVVTLQEKSDVLLVPQRAVRSAGQRRYVEYLEGDSRRTADVTTGISGAVDVEILNGLKEGQLVLVSTLGSAPAVTPSVEATQGGTSP